MMLNITQREFTDEESVYLKKLHNKVFDLLPDCFFYS